MQVNKAIFEIWIKVKEEKDEKIKDKIKLKLSLNHWGKTMHVQRKDDNALEVLTKNVEFDWINEEWR